jgi:hypothetical protein
MAEHTTSHASSAWFIVFFAIGAATLLILLVVTGVLVWSFYFHRQLLHVERMRAIETGHPLDTTDPGAQQAKYMHNAFWISFWLGFGVPAAAFGSAYEACGQLGKSFLLAATVWAGAALASAVSVMCATALMIHSRSGQLDDVLKLIGLRSKP